MRIESEIKICKFATGLSARFTVRHFFIGLLLIHWSIPCFCRHCSSTGNSFCCWERLFGPLTALVSGKQWWLEKHQLFNMLSTIRCIYFSIKKLVCGKNNKCTDYFSGSGPFDRVNMFRAYFSSFEGWAAIHSRARWISTGIGGGVGSKSLWGW